jgi:hypothetical protein
MDFFGFLDFGVDFGSTSESSYELEDFVDFFELDFFELDFFGLSSTYSSFELDFEPKFSLELDFVFFGFGDDEESSFSSMFCSMVAIS